jgi:hypothetical protein
VRPLWSTDNQEKLGGERSLPEPIIFPSSLHMLPDLVCSRAIYILDIRYRRYLHLDFRPLLLRIRKPGDRTATTDREL